MRLRVAAAGVFALGAATVAMAVSGNGTIFTYAGTGAPGFSGDGGRATAAQLNAPSGLAFDGAGNLYVADSGNHRIRRVTTDGVISTIAGTGTGGFSGDGGPATAAQLFSPQGIAFDSAGNLYIADMGNNRIRRIGTDGRIATVAGNGTADQSEDGTPALAAALNEPNAVAVDRNGAVILAEEDRILRIAGDGTIRTVAGGLFSSGYNGDGIPATSATLDSPTGLAVDGAGNIYISDADNQRLRRVGTDGVIRTVAGTGAGEYSGDGGAATAARINGPWGIDVGADGSVYFADSFNHRIRKILPDGNIITIAGGGENRRQFVPARQAEIGAAREVAVDRAGNLYFADAEQHRVAKVSDLTAEVGTVGRAWVSQTRTGSATKRVSSETREIWAHFQFAEQPAVGLPIVIEFYSPRGRLAAVQKPRAARVEAALRRQRNAVFALGRWRAVLRVANRPIRTVAFDVKPFRTK